MVCAVSQEGVKNMHQDIKVTKLKVELQRAHYLLSLPCNTCNTNTCRVAVKGMDVTSSKEEKDRP